jgi:UDP-N-acetylmuramoyl-tripeptide--D-alanyl-D-alanine ligase
MKLSLGQIADWIHAEGDFNEEALALGYSIDSRTLAARDLFFAVKGERVDGHDYIESALANGAVAAVVSMRWLRPETVEENKLLRVPDEDADCVLHAMQRLAREVRRHWNREGNKRVIGITGSVGKTTTKECVAAALSPHFKVLKSEGNFNNHFGLPLQLLRLEPEHDVAVLEMGMNHAGEIRALAAIAEPDWAVVSNVAPVHLEFFSDGIEGIARAKYELIESLPPNGLAFLNADDERVAAFGKGMGSRAIFYGTREGADFRATNIEEQGLSGTDFTLQVGGTRNPVVLRLPGRHNILNALAAFAVAWHAGVDGLDSLGALESLRPTAKRGNLVEFRGATIVNDTYNSNPRALMAMVEALLSAEATRRLVVAGEMLELGPEADALHRSCGEAMAGIDLVLGVRGHARALAQGAATHGIAAEFVETPEAAAAWMRQHLRPGDVVLLKASRGVRLERALDALLASPEPEAPKG